MDAALRRRVGRLLGGDVAEARPAGGGYTPAARFVVAMTDGRSAFVKAAVNPLTTEWLRAERRVYASLSGAFLPRMIAWDDTDHDAPVLVLEDLSGAHWPPPWRPGDVELVRAVLDELAATPAPHGLPPAAEMFQPDGWSAVAADPRPFLGLALATSAWLDNALPALIAAERALSLAGTSLLHLDVRSDNLCLRGGQALLVDWNHAASGNPLIDEAFWLPSLELEGGPPPEALLPHEPEAAAAVAGYFAAGAGLPPIADAPRVRPSQLAQLRLALPWAARALGLPPLGS